MKEGEKNKKVISENTKKDKTWLWNIKSLGITVKITRAPEVLDKNSNKMSVKESIYMGVALSIDSFGAGISSAVSGMNNLFVPIMVGVCQFVFLSFGIICGQKLTSFKRIDSDIFMVLSGALLIILAFVRYFF